jgi:hypothetical protein
MAKRFTETNKWQDDWFCTLTNDEKVIWQYLNDHCSVAGVVKKGLKHLNYFCGTKFTEAKLLEVFGSKLIDLGECFFLPSFILEQYPTGLSSDKPLIVSVRRELEASNHYLMIEQSLPNHYPMIRQSLDNDKPIIKERERVKERVKEKEKVKEEEGGAGGRVYTDAMTIYHEFVKLRTGVPPNINVIEGKSLKSIIVYLRGIDKNDEKVLQAWNAVLNNYDKWDAFLQKQLNLSQISKNLMNIINSIKNGKPTTNARREITNEDLAAELRKRYPDSVR